MEIYITNVSENGGIGMYHTFLRHRGDAFVFHWGDSESIIAGHFFVLN